MSAQLLIGKDVAQKVYEQVLLDLSLLPIVPKLVVVLVGEDPASETYVRSKQKKCEDLGMRGQTLRLSATTPEAELLEVIRSLNADPDVTGVLVQLPLPKHIDRRKVLMQIDPLKDVDGLHPTNAGLLVQGCPRFIPCTPAGVMEMIRFAGVDLTGKEAVVVGRSEIVGQPMAQLLLQANATVTMLHSKTRDLRAHTRRAEILVVAMGRPRAIGADAVADGAVVIDVGIHRTPSGLCGDVQTDEVRKRASWITPVPGGVGPMTIAMLMKNVCRAAVLQTKVI